MIGYEYEVGAVALSMRVVIWIEPSFFNTGIVVDPFPLLNETIPAETGSASLALSANGKPTVMAALLGSADVADEELLSPLIAMPEFALLGTVIVETEVVL